MKISLLSIMIFISSLALAQNDTKSLQLTNEQVAETFTAEVKFSFGIAYPIFRAYQYQDKKGEHIILFTEKLAAPNKSQPHNQAIKAFIFEAKDKHPVKLSKTIEGYRSDEANTASEEQSIWFWTKYLSLTDLDKDSLVDPIIVYGTSGLNQHQDGRIKIVVIHQDTTVMIHHQNGTLDSQRNTKIDREFYELPAPIQSKVISIMNTLVANGHAIFPSGWETAIQNKATTFDEN